MAVLRKEKKGDFTVIDNAIFRNQGLSLKAKGMLCLLLSLPDYWEFSVAGLVKLSTDGKSAVTSALNELEDAGYFRREQARNNGNFGGAVYVISEVPFSEKPMTENPISENPMTGNLPQLNTNKSNTNKSITKDIYTTEFENLWSLYPRKQGKDKAYKYYEKARKSGTTYEEVECGIYAYIRYIQAEQTEQQYIKMGSTFFSQKAWEDDWTVVLKPKSSGNPFDDLHRRMTGKGVFDDFR